MDNKNEIVEIKTEFNWDCIEVGDYNLNHSENFFATTRTTKKENIKQEEQIQLSWEEQDNKEYIAPTQKTQEHTITIKYLDAEGEQLEILETGSDAGVENVKPNIRSCWSPISKSPTSGSENSCSAVAPRAYEFKAVYDQRRQNALRQREEEERKARQFHSRPVPNFKAMHKRLQDMIVVQKFTLPTTPETLKHSRKRQVDPNRVDEMNGKDSRAALTEVKPFQLRSEQRVRERRGFDAAMQKQLAERKQQQDEQRKQQEEEQIREIRKKTEFKARPNPFK